MMASGNYAVTDSPEHARLRVGIRKGSGTPPPARRGGPANEHGGRQEGGELALPPVKCHVDILKY